MSEAIQFPFNALEKLLPVAFDEDVGSGDITSMATIPEMRLLFAFMLAVIAASMLLPSARISMTLATDMVYFLQLTKM